MKTHEIFLRTSPDIDQYFGLEIDRIESFLLKEARSLRPDGDLSNLGHVLHNGHQTWIGLDPQTLNTPYEELVRMCDLLTIKDGEHVVDLGAGYGRMGLVLHQKNPGIRFTGYELVKERVEEGNRIFREQNCLNHKLIEQDLMSPEFTLPIADYYFIYDFGKTEHIRKTLKQLEMLADKNRFKVIARGKGTRSIIDFEHPWLSDINPVLREENFAIYSY